MTDYDIESQTDLALIVKTLRAHTELIYTLQVEIMELREIVYSRITKHPDSPQCAIVNIENRHA